MSGRLQSYNRYLVKTGETDKAYPGRVSVAGAAIDLPTIPADTNSAVVAIIAASGAVAGTVIANYRLDGGDPTTVLGMPLYSGGEIQLFESEVENFRIIAADGLTHSLAVEFGKVE